MSVLICYEVLGTWHFEDYYSLVTYVRFFEYYLGDSINSEFQDIYNKYTPISNPTSTGSISGTMHVNSATGTPLSGAMVTCGIQTVETASNGSFSFSGIPEGSYRVIFSKSGYQTYERSVLVAANSNTDVGNRWLVEDYDIPPSNSGPDLAINKLTISKNGEENKHSLHLIPGEDYYIKVTIKNRGVATATQAYNIGYLLSDDNKIEQSDSLIGSESDKEDITAGKTHKNGKHFSAPSTPGIYYIGARVDSPQDSNKLNDYSRGDDERARITVEYPAPINSYTISGTVLYNGTALSGVYVTLTGIGSQSITTGADGGFTFTGATNGYYTLTFSKQGYSFPTSVAVTVNDGNVSFTGNSSIIASLGTNAGPTAIAGTYSSVTVGTAVTLDGSSSIDPDNDITTYLWEQTGGPETVALSTPYAVTTQFTPFSEGTYTFKLTVTDAGGLSSEDSCSVRVDPQRTITITDPVDGETWSTGPNIDHTINWESQNIGSSSTNVRIDYFYKGTWRTLTDNTPNDGSKVWNMEDSPYDTIITSDDSNARVRITSVEYPAVSDETSSFTINHVK